MKPRHALRWLNRQHERPPRACHACIVASIHHPAGPLHRYTTARLHGLPVCERHTLTEADELLRRTP
jgi:hypothetical protein